METVDVGVTAVYFYPPHPTPPAGLSAMLTHLQLQPTQAHVWHGRNCYLDWSQQESFSQLRLTLFGGEDFGLWQEQWQQLANHHQQIACLGSTLVYWAVHEEELAMVDWQPFVPTRFSFAEPVLVPRPETAVYLCYQSLGHHVYVALTRKEQTIHRRLIYNQTFWDLEQLWHRGEQAKQAWLDGIDPDLLDCMVVLETAVDTALAMPSNQHQRMVAHAYAQFGQQLNAVNRQERVARVCQMQYKKKAQGWTAVLPTPLWNELFSPVSEEMILELQNQAIICLQYQATIKQIAQTSWRKLKWHMKKLTPLLIN